MCALSCLDVGVVVFAVVVDVEVTAVSSKQAGTQFQIAMEVRVTVLVVLLTDHAFGDVDHFTA